MIVPGKLAKGKAIGIYSPSASVTCGASRLAQYEKGLQVLRARGYPIKEAAHARGRYHHMAATAEQKASDIHALFTDPEVGAIIPSIGGHTASQVLPHLELGLIRQHPKIFVGFSDSSVLAMYIAHGAGLVTFHSAADVAFGFSRLGELDSPLQGKGHYSAERFFEALEQGVVVPQPFSPWVGLIDGEASGTILGGNIKGVLALVGTPYEPSWDGVILYWESADPPHVIAQVLAHLRNARVLDRIAGMVVGKVAHLKETFYSTDEIMPVHDFIRYVLRGVSIPVAVECDIGHDVENITIPNGCQAHLEVKGGFCKLSLGYGAA